MKNVTISSEEYEEVLYPAVALARPTTTDEIQQATAVKEQLDDIGMPKPQTDTAKDQGLPQLYVLVNPEATLALEDSQAEWLRKALTKAIENQMFVTDKAGLALNVRTRIEKAPTEKVGADGVDERKRVDG